MASVRHSLFSLLAPYTNNNTTRTPRRVLASSRTRHRKNYLRPKILKTLTPTLPLPPPPPPPPPPPRPIVLPQENNLSVEIPADETHGGDVAGVTEEPGKLEELRTSKATARDNGASAAEIVKYGGMYLIGAFVLQTVCYLWITGNYNSNRKDEDLEIDGRGNGNGKTMQLAVAGVEDQLGMEKKIEEIRLMAREARRIELENRGEEDDEDEDFEIDNESAVSSHKLGFEKEIGARLLKLQKRINGANKDSSAVGMGRDVNKNGNQGHEAMVFRKKFKFRSPSTMATETPKGFPGTPNWRKEKDLAGKDHGSDAVDHAQISYKDKQVNHPDNFPSEERGEFVDYESNTKNSEDKMEKPNMRTKVGAKTRRTNNGGIQETNFGMSSREVIQSSKSRELRTQNSQGTAGEENHDVHSINGSSRQGLAKNNSAANRVKVKQANTKADMWWLNLGYVHVVLMQRSSEGGSKGLYSLNFTSKEQDQSDDSYTVAFEDRADANNFCFVLESFFQDLGDFSADAIPISIQELNEEIISRAKKVFVVKKRQLELYAGQPLSDVEMALCSIIKQDQNVP